MSDKSFNIEYSIGEVKDKLKELFLCSPQTVVGIWGPPGIGKTEIQQQLQRELSEETKTPWKLFDVRIAHYDSIEVKGVPYRDGNFTRWLTPDIWPTENVPTILFLDEFTNAPASVQNAILQLLCEKKLHGYTLPDQVRIVLAGNKAEHGAFANKLSLPVLNRMIHFFVKASAEDVLKYWNSLPEEKEIRSEIVNFIDFRRELLHNMEKALQDESCHAFPTPRTWESLSKIWTSIAKYREDHNKKELSTDEINSFAVATIGQSAAAEFTSFITNWVRIRPGDVIEKGKMPDIQKNDASFMFACTGAVTDYFINSVGRRGNPIKDHHVKNFFQFVDLLPKEFQVRVFNLANFNENQGHIRAARNVMREELTQKHHALRDLLKD